MLNPQQIQEMRAKAGIPAEGFGAQQQNNELAQQRIAKFKAGAEHIRMNTPDIVGITPQQQADNRATLESIISKFPGQELGKSVGTAIHGLISQAQGNTAEASQSVQDINANMGKTIGDTAQAMAMPATFALNPGTGVIKNALEYGAVGGIQGGGKSLAEGNDLKTVAKDAFKSALISGGIAATVTGAINAIDKYAHKAPEHLYNNAMKVLQRMKNAGKNPSKFISDNGVWGDLGAIKKASDEGIQATNSNIRSAIEQRASTVADTISNHLTSSQQVLDNLPEEEIAQLGGMPELLNRTKTNIVDALKNYGIKDVAKAVDNIDVSSLSSLDDLANQVNAAANAGHTYQGIKQLATEKLSTSLGGLYSKPEMEALIDRVPVSGLRDAVDGNLSIDLLDQVRSKLGALIGDTRWTAANPGENVKAAQSMYRALSDTVKEATGTTNEFAKLSNWLNTQKVVDRAIDLADGKYGIGLRDLIGTGAGALIGGSQGDSFGKRVFNTVLGGAAGFGAERLATSPTLQTGLAQGLNAIAPHVQEYGKAFESAITALVGNSVKPSP